MIRALLVGVVSLLAAGCPSRKESAAPAVGSPVVREASLLRAQLSQTLVVDARKPEEYVAGHIPGAISLPASDTFDPAQAKNHPRTAKDLAQLLGQRGISRDRPVVTYDNGKETTAARIFWTLEWAGHENVAVLNGGLGAWKAAGGELSSAAPTIRPVEFAILPRPQRMATKESSRAAIGQSSSVIVDCRTPAEYRGEDKRAKFGGHIPGAVNLDWSMNFGENGQLKDAVSLRKVYESAGVTVDKTVVAHCQSGQRSSVTYWALRSLGYPKVSNYAGSWVEWGNDPETPKETSVAALALPAAAAEKTGK